MYRIAGNLRGRKLSRISRIFDHQRKFSPRNSRCGIHHVSYRGSYVGTQLRYMLAIDRDVPVEVLSAELHDTKV